MQVFLATFRTRYRDIQLMRSRLIEPWPDIFSGHVISKFSHVLPFHSHAGSGVEKLLNRENSTQEIEGGTLKKKCWMEIKRKFDPISCLHLSISFLLASFSWHLYILYKVRVFNSVITLFYDNSPVQSWQGIKMKSFWECMMPLSTARAAQ